MPKNLLEEDQENLERWLLTYADLITLLLAFFIVLYSMSRIDVKKFDKISDALNDALKGSPSVLKGNVSMGGGPLKLKDLRVIKHQIQNFIIRENLEKDIEITRDERGLVIHITESAFFETGEADIKPKAQDILKKLSGIFEEIPNEIRIEGHTDNVPIKTVRFPSNWELSTARATGVLRFLAERCSIKPDKISALGFGEYRPLATNTTLDGRRRNRRTDIVILKAEAGQFEPASYKNGESW